MARNRKYWIVKHGLDALQALPRYIWRTGTKDEPKKFKSVRPGDQWMGFAYASDDEHKRTLSLITGYYQCIRGSTYRRIPAKGQQLEGSGTHAWMIEGQSLEKNFGEPVSVPPIDQLLGRKHFKGQSLVPIEAADFQKIKKYVREHRLKSEQIPVLAREPRYEQGMLAIIGQAYSALGIEKILCVQTAFPDLLVKLKGRREPVYLELELYSQSYFAHGHPRKGSFTGIVNGIKQKYPVGVLCWIDNVGVKKFEDDAHIPNVFSMKDLLRTNRQIKWRR